MKLPLSLALCAILSSSAFALPAFGPEHEPNPEIQRRTEWTSAFNYSVPRWEWWPSLGPLPTNPKGAYLNTSDGVEVWFATMGDPAKKPVVLLHGGEGNSNQMFNKAKYLYDAGWFVIVQDTRGQGRSPYTGFTKFHYDDMARDIIAVLDHLKVPKAAFVGWSDGAITALNLGMNYTERVDRIFAHGANAQWNMTIPDPAPTLPNRLRKRDDPYSYAALSPTPEREADMEAGVSVMWGSEPTWGPEAFAKIVNVPTWIVDADRDGSITRNQPDAMAAWIPNAGELIIPNGGHSILLEDPVLFNLLMNHFLSQEYVGALPVY